ncbi:MAG: hypothetical protein AAB638_02110 [Patescibacteria group bacterium]
MDDTSPKSTASQSNIDELVKELSRPQGSAPTPSAPAPTTSTPPPMGQSPVSSMPSRPTPLQPVTPSAKPTPSAPPKEYQSSIRTMTEDLSKLKAGQQPQGVNIPRKIDNTPAPQPVKPVAPQQPTPPTRPSSNPVMPAPMKSAPMPSASAKPVPAPLASIPKPAMPTMPPATKTPSTSTDQKNQFYVPDSTAKSTGSGSSSKGILFAGIALVVVIFGGLYWYFIVRTPASDIVDAIPTFTPRPSPTQNPDPLVQVFPNQDGTIVLPVSGDPATAFKNGMASQPTLVSGGLVYTKITSSASASAQPLTVTGLLDRFLVQYPSALKTSLGSKYRFLLYGQKEAFDSKGKPITVTSISPRFVIVSEIASSSASMLKSWEISMSTNLATVMSIDASKNVGPFMTTNYRSLDVHFKNFPYPDRSIDYATISYAGKNYLIIAGSREAMFSTLDAFAVPGK